jgi:hypothetical protein
MFSFLLIILLNTLIVSGKNYSSLTETLMVDYNHNIIPLLNNDYVNLTMGMALRSLNKIDQMDGTLSANLWLRYWWEDEYLKWNPADWDGITSIVLYTDIDEPNVIWTPDMYLYNTAEKPMENLKFSRAILNHHGQITWSRPGIIQSTCVFDLTHFPYDKQTCDFKLGSWSYSGNLLKLKTNENALDVSNYQTHEEWDLVEHNTYLNIKTYECCPDPYYDITFSIELSRKPDFYVLNVIIPTFATASLMLISLLIPWDSGERISFVITVMLSIIVFLLLLSENIPKSNKEPLLSRMIIGLVFFSLTVVFVTVLLSYMRNYKYGNNKYIDKLLYYFNICKEPQPQIHRTNSYIDTIDGQNNTIEENCKQKSDKIEFMFSILFVIAFIVFCFVMNVIRPEH